MARTESFAPLLGTAAPAFSLPDVVTGELVSLDTFASRKSLLVMFICRHCPFVVHVQDELARLGNDYAGTDAGIVAISSNDAVSYPDDAPPRLKEMAESLGFRFPVCYDESQDVARAYGAVCTPDFFLYDRERRLAYRGQLDSSRPSNQLPVDGRSLRAAIEAVRQGKPVPQPQIPSVGCSIKWKRRSN
ncbi:MAG: thioredoxin family protein [Bryobacterales bacterium]|jgi:peroxiredoxin|nr:thioredoxin family protein [Bryobacterales bacterium]